MHLYKTINETYIKLEPEHKITHYPAQIVNITETPLPQNNWTSLETESVIPTQVTLVNSTKIMMPHNVVSALMDVTDSLDKSSHQLMLLILIGLFMLISLCLTIAVLVFCKKKNSVFMLQKCEQDSEYELDDINNTEVENTDSEYEDLDAPISDHRRSETYPCLSKVSNDASNGKYREKCLQKDGTHCQSDSGSPSTIPLLRTSNMNLLDSQGNKSRQAIHRPSLKKSFTFSTSHECKKLLKEQKSVDISVNCSTTLNQRQCTSESISTAEYEDINTDTYNEEYCNNTLDYDTSSIQTPESFEDNFSTNFIDETAWPSDTMVHTVEATIEHHSNIGDMGLVQEDEVLDFTGKLEIL